MRAVLLIAVLAFGICPKGWAAEYDVVLDLYGVSKHGQSQAEGARYNESNPGFGIALTKNENKRRIVFQVGTYEDSHGESAKFVAAQYQFGFFSQHLFLGAGVFVGQSPGYYHGAAFVAPLPTISVALNRALLVNAIYIPQTNRGEGNPHTLGIFASYRLGEI